MQKIQGVSFPRSGHHLLTHCLTQYFANEFGYCSDVFRDQQFQNPQITYQKNHDFDLNLPITPGMKYLVQYRHPLESLVSWYRWEVNNGIQAERNYGWRPLMNNYVPLWNLYTHRDTRKRWTIFLKKRLPFWSKFVEKWFLNSNQSSLCYVNYSDLVQDSFTTISRVILFFDSETDLNTEKLHKIISENNIHPRNDIKNFKFFDPKVFQNIEKSLAHQIDLANIKPLF